MTQPNKETATPTYAPTEADEDAVALAAGLPRELVETYRRIQKRGYEARRQLMEKNRQQDALLSAQASTLEELRGEFLRLEEYAFGMETAVRGARASGRASELSMWQAECAELRLQNAQLKERMKSPTLR